MKLYYSPGACSLSPHIVARELGLSFELKKVNTKDKTIEGGGDYWKVNPRGYVPALELDNGQVLTEGPAIVQYLADQKPDSGLAPKNGSSSATACRSGSTSSPPRSTRASRRCSSRTRPRSTRRSRKENLASRFDWLDKQLAGKDYLTGKAVHRRRRVPLRAARLDQVPEQSTSRAGRTSPRSRSASARGRRCRKRCRPKAC